MGIHASLAILVALAAGGEPPMLLDDFSVGDVAPWRYFSDRVMGGVSSGEASVEDVNGRRALRLRGTVSLANRGGFVQVARSISPEDGPFDASAYRGLRLEVLARRDGYWVHLRSEDTRAPWQYYAAPIPAGAGWRTVEIPFASFRPANLVRPLDTSRILRVALVAAWEEFDADLAVARVELYR